jgi:hypothetical protein
VPLGAAAVLIAGLVANVPSASATPSEPVVVVSGLNNPRQIVLVDGGAGPELLIAEAGKGGTVIGTGDDAQSVGLTGAISSVFNPASTVGSKPKRVVTGLLSGASPDGTFAVGSDGVAARFSGGKIYVQITYAPPDLVPPPVAAQSGKLLFAQHNGGVAFPAADISAVENTDPDHQGFDSDPYAALARKDDILVADAAGNDILRVGNQGYGPVTVWHVFPNILDGDCANRPPEGPGRNPGCDFVPTSLAQDAQGNIYVGALAGEAGGEGRVVKLDPSGKTVLKTWTGLTTVTGVAVGKDGSVYASELFGGSESAPGDLVKISPNGTRTVVTVPFPAGVAVDAADNVFVSAWSVATDAGFGPPNSSGQIWRLRF